MEEQWIVDRSNLRILLEEQPEWSRKRMAAEIGRSLSWVKKWVKRIGEAEPDDERVLHGRSRARKNPPPRLETQVVEKILEIRDEPPRNLRRTPGPKTILYYLQQDEELKTKGCRLPRGTRTVWEVLKRNHRILGLPSKDPEPLERPEPWQEWGVDFKDVSSVPAEEGGKQQHVVEILNIIDHGTSVLVDSQPHEAYTAETALMTLAEVIQKRGRPRRVTLDRDPRWVGSWQGKDFPSALLRFLICLGIEPVVCPPQRPDKNPFVERYNHNLKYECLLLEMPQDLQTTIEVNQEYVQHYNHERPSQALTCDNQPPRVAHPDEMQLPSLPEQVNPDAWLRKIHSKRYKRRIDYSGRVQIGKQKYYVQKKLKGRYVVLWVDAKNEEFAVELNKKFIKRIPIKGLYRQKMPYSEFLEMARKEAVSDWRRWKRSRTPRYGVGSR